MKNLKFLARSTTSTVLKSTDQLKQTLNGVDVINKAENERERRLAVQKKT